jgi:hypothetical protein
MPRAAAALAAGDRADAGSRRTAQQMQVDAEARRFDVIIVEALGPMKQCEFQKIGVRLPPDVHEWLSAQAERNQFSINSEIIRSIRDAMDREADCISADLGRSQ